MATDGLHVGFRRHLRAEVVPEEATYLLSPRGVTALFGEHIQALAPLLDGTRTLREVLSEAGCMLPAVEAGRLIAELGRAGLIGYRDATQEPGDGAAQAYWDLAASDGLRTAQERTSTVVEVLAVGRCDAAEARAACRDSGLTVAPASDRPTPGAAGFSLVVCDDYLAPELQEIDAWHRAAGRPWLLTKPVGAEAWTGPVFRPGEGACWSCLATRLRGHRRAELAVQHALGGDGLLPRPEASLAAGRALGLHMAVLEAVKWLGGIEHPCQGAVSTLDTLTLRTSSHRVQRRPQCAACGDPSLVARRAIRPVVPASRPKATRDGGYHHRALCPEQMLDRYGHLIGPVTGIVTGVRRDDRTPEGLNRYVSGHNLALAGHGLGWVRGGLRSLSGGKGVTALEAQVSAMCEAVERHSGTRQGDEPVIHDSLTGLGEEALHPNTCQLFAEWQFRDREHWNTRHSPLQQVPAPFDPSTPTAWTPVWSLTAGSQRLLPTSLLYFGPGPGGPAQELWADSNGNAAGSSLEDAIVQGFLELVERDAVAQWWYNRTRRPAVGLDTFDEPWLARLREAYARAGRRVWVLDLTSDFGIPVMAALSRRPDGPAEDIAFGFGAHFDPRFALRRALTEMAQLLPTGSGDTGYGTTDPDLVSWWSGATIRNQPYLMPDPAESARTPTSYPYTPHSDIRQEIAMCERLVRERDMEMLVLDQTRPDAELPVAKVVVPGMRHIWARLAPGRLFDVPVQLGHLDRRTYREELNPIPLFV
ncbi:TOMM precursor leader peptide-binding protein [Streptomyces sp. NPDC002536]